MTQTVLKYHYVMKSVSSHEITMRYVSCGHPRASQLLARLVVPGADKSIRIPSVLSSVRRIYCSDICGTEIVNVTLRCRYAYIKENENTILFFELKPNVSQKRPAYSINTILSLMLWLHVK